MAQMTATQWTHDHYHAGCDRIALIKQCASATGVSYDSARRAYKTVSGGGFVPATYKQVAISGNGGGMFSVEELVQGCDYQGAIERVIAEQLRGKTDVMADYKMREEAAVPPSVWEINAGIPKFAAYRIYIPETSKSIQRGFYWADAPVRERIRAALVKGGHDVK
jgi:hypothetical protein